MRSMPSRPEFRRDVPLAPRTTFRIGGPAAAYAEAGDVAALAALWREAVEHGWRVRWLGGGSNILVNDGGVDGAVIRLARNGAFGALTIDRAYVEVGAAVPLARLVRACADAGLSGLEAFAAIPGTVGGALAMNAGGANGLANRAAWVDVLRAGENAAHRLEPGPLWIPTYRDGGMGDGVALRAAFILSPAPVDEVKANTAAAARAKAARQPLAWPSAGCVFRNPPHDAAGRLIDAAGLKDTRVGGAAISAQHANFIVNVGGASARDVHALARLVEARVFERFGVHLAREIISWP